MDKFVLSESILEKYNSIVNEVVEYIPLSEMVNESVFEGSDIFEHVFVEDFESIDEGAVVTFGGKTYPRDGWCVLLSGGAGLVM